ncbi:MAG: tyrosine-protein phosphatase, partial [Phycisphaerae bacterium]
MVRRVGRRATSAGLSVALVIAGCGQDCCPRGVEPARSASGRWLLLEGLANARDLGGYPTEDGRSVRWGLLYRSAALNSLTEAGCEGFAGLGIRTVIDLRNRLSPSPLFGGDVPCVHCCSEVILLPVRP